MDTFLQSGILAGIRPMVTRLHQCHCDRCGDADREPVHADCTKNADFGHRASRFNWFAAGSGAPSH